MYPPFAWRYRPSRRRRSSPRLRPPGRPSCAPRASRRRAQTAEGGKKLQHISPPKDLGQRTNLDDLHDGTEGADVASVEGTAAHFVGRTDIKRRRDAHGNHQIQMKEGGARILVDTDQQRLRYRANSDNALLSLGLACRRSNEWGRSHVLSYRVAYG